MEDFFSRYKNPLVLMVVLFLQVIILASNVPRDNPRAPNSGRGVTLIRVWAVNAITPLERALVNSGHFIRNTWRGYVDLHDVRRENRDLQEEVKRLRLEQVRYREAASETQRLQALLGFKERFVSQTMAAQVIGSGGNEQSRVVYIDRGSRAGIHSDMAVISPDGIVGKVKDAFTLSSQVLLITDRDSGAGVILSRSRLQGVLRGTSQGELVLDGIMADEKITPGEEVITSGGDRIYPKGMPVGTVVSATRDRNDPSPFLTIKVKPAADLSRLEEVLVVTRIAEESLPSPETGGRTRAADLLGEHLPTLTKVEPTSGGETANPPPGGEHPADAAGLKKGKAGPQAGSTSPPAGAGKKSKATVPGPAPAGPDSLPVAPAGEGTRKAATLKKATPPLKKKPEVVPAEQKPEEPKPEPPPPPPPGEIPLA